MKKSVVFIVCASALIVAGCVSLTAIKNYKKDPPLAADSGLVRVPGLAGEVLVLRDDYGVPHIVSDNEHDLFFAIGWVHAQDRLWEMILFRAISQGRMSELFGNIGVPGIELMGFRASMFEIDKRQRTFGMKFMGELGEALLKEQDPKVYGQLRAYCDGVNAYLARHDKLSELPLEFHILKVKPEPWQIADIISFGRFIGSMLSSNLEIELARWSAISEFGPDRAWELVPLFHHQGPKIVPTELLHNRLETPRELPPGGRPSDFELGAMPPLSGADARRMLFAHRLHQRALRLDSEIGSNSWIVSGKLTASGKPIMANDPHLSHIQPSLFYLQRIKGAGYDAYGVTFPGNPYVVLGHTHRLAWSATTTRADVMDLFVETADPARPGQYKYQGEWLDFYEREEVIRVRSASGMKERRITVRHSVHGPIVNEVMGGLGDSPPIALRWTGWDLSRDLRAFELAVSSGSAAEFMERYHAQDEKFELLNICRTLEILNRGETIEDFIKAMDLLVLPSQNWAAADADGRIAYLPGGLVPLRKRGLGVLPAPGEDGAYDWIGFIPLMELPHLIDPERGWLVTANNEVVDARWYPYVFSTHYGEPWRAMRIEELLDKNQAPFDVDDMKTIQNDIYVKRAEWQVPIIMAAVEKKQPQNPLALRAADELKRWDYQADLESTATVIFFQFLKELQRNLLEDECVDWQVYKLEGYPDMAVNLWLERGWSSFANDKRTAEVEDLDDMIVKSLADAMAWVEKKYGKDPEGRQWGKVHYIKWYHPLGLIGEHKNLSVGPFPYEGANQTVRMAKEAGFGRDPYKALTGACLRHVIDLADPDGAQIIIDGSQSGQWMSPHYDDLHPLFVRGEYITADKDLDRVSKKARRLILAP